MMIASNQYGGQGSARDDFLDALDEGNTRRALEIATTLTSCTNPLPSTTCVELRLPPGSTYAAAARFLLAESGDAKQRTNVP